jgi:putative methanogenesis marker protein 8
MAKHVIEALGKTKVVIEDGKVVEVGEPKVRYCPLFAKHRDVKEITRDFIWENMEFRIQDFGMCTPERKLWMQDFLSFGVSELLSMAVSKHILDVAVIVCDGAGTVVVSEPEMIQGIGGRMSGMIQTAPLEKVIDGIGRENVLDPEKATIDQFAGVEMAFRLGFRTIGVTIARAEDARAIRDGFGDSVMIIAVHTSGVSDKEAKTFFDCCDLVAACASKSIRELARTRALLQAGNKVPIYAASARGKALLEERFRQTGTKPAAGLEDPPRPLF